MSHHPAAPTSTPLRRHLARVIEHMRGRGLLDGRSETITAQLNPELLRLAKERTGVEDNGTLVELALANLADEDGFPEAFARSRGRVPPDIDLD
jgi:hypothetical protein